MKRLLAFLFPLMPILCWAANPSFDSFRQTNSGFIVNQPYIYVANTNTGGMIVYTNTTINYFNTTNNYDGANITITNSNVVFTNSNVTINGTNVATINPTVGRIPFKFSDFQFGDSALYYIDTNTVGTTDLQTGIVGVSNLVAGGFVISVDSGLGYGYLTNAPFTDIALWTNSGFIYRPSQREDQMWSTNHVIFGTTGIGGALVFNVGSGSNTVAGENDLNVFLQSYFPVYATTTNASDTTIRLNSGNGSGTVLMLQNMDGNSFQLLNGDALWDNPVQHLYLSGGDWKPDSIGETLLLIGSPRGWAEIGRFGGPTNIVTEQLWKFAGGYLQPTDLTQPLSWTNSVTWGPGTTNVLSRLDNALVWALPYVAPNTVSSNALTILTGGTNRYIFSANQAPSGAAGLRVYGDNGTKFVTFGTKSDGADAHVVAGAGGAVWLQPNQTSGTAYAFTTGAFSSSPTQGADLGSVANVFKDAYFYGTNRIYGHISGTGETNISLVAIYHTGTNGAVVFDSQASGSAGAGRRIEFDFDGVNRYTFDYAAGNTTFHSTDAASGLQLYLGQSGSSGSLITTAATLVLGVPANNIQLVSGAILANASDSISIGTEGAPFKSLFLGHNQSYFQTTGDATFVDMTRGSQTNVVSGPISILYATNGVTGIDEVHTRWFINSSGSNQAFSIPSQWRTNFYSAVPPALTNGVTTLMMVRCNGLVGAASQQTNCYVKFEYYQ